MLGRVFGGLSVTATPLVGSSLTEQDIVDNIRRKTRGRPRKAWEEDMRRDLWDIGLTREDDRDTAAWKAAIG